MHLQIDGAVETLASTVPQQPFLLVGWLLCCCARPLVGFWFALVVVRGSAPLILTIVVNVPHVWSAAIHPAPLHITV